MGGTFALSIAEDTNAFARHLKTSKIGDELIDPQGKKKQKSPRDAGFFVWDLKASFQASPKGTFLSSL